MKTRISYLTKLLIAFLLGIGIFSTKVLIAADLTSADGMTLQRAQLKLTLPTEPFYFMIEPNVALQCRPTKAENAYACAFVVVPK